MSNKTWAEVNIVEKNIQSYYENNRLMCPLHSNFKIETTYDRELSLLYNCYAINISLNKGNAWNNLLQRSFLALKSTLDSNKLLQI